ncbi:enhancin, partial [Bacillus cereus]|nr:enhancin [Bacillus cereus]
VGWLFNFGKKEQVERNLYNALMKENKNYDDLDLRQKLILLTMAKQKAGDEAFAKMYQGYRKLASNATFKKGDHSLPDLMNQYYSENVQVDFTPVFERWGFKLNHKQIEMNRAKGYPAVTSLAYIVPESQLAKARALVDPDIPINSNFEIVTNQQIASLGLKGNLHIHLNTNEIDTLKGGKIKLKEGNTVIQEKTIETADINLQDVPNGVYTVEISGEKTDRMYHFRSYYAYVKEKDNSLTIDVNEMKVSNLVNETIQFLGLGDDQFAELNTDLEQKRAVFTVTTKTPHSYYAGEKYASIELFNEKGEKIYTKEMEGTNVTIVKDTIPLKEGYKIKIYHDEIKKRLTSKATIINPMNKTNEFIMTKWGLKNTYLKNNPEENLMKRIDEEMEAIISNPFLKEIPMQKLEMKKNVWMAINMLSEPQKITYMNKYKDSVYNE